MNISPINNSQSFKGLWGKVSETGDVSAHNCIRFVTKDYYPFKDETPEEISNVERFNKKHYEAQWFETGGINVREDVSVETKRPLNFTKNEFEKYKLSNTGTKTPEAITHPVEKELVAKGLLNYLNNYSEYNNEMVKRSSFGYKAKTLLDKLVLKLKRL